MFKWGAGSVAQRSGPGRRALNRPEALKLAVARDAERGEGSWERPGFRVPPTVLRMS